MSGSCGCVCAHARRGTGCCTRQELNTVQEQDREVSVRIRALRRKLAARRSVAESSASDGHGESRQQLSARRGISLRVAVVKEEEGDGNRSASASGDDSDDGDDDDNDDDDDDNCDTDGDERGDRNTARTPALPPKLRESNVVADTLESKDSDEGRFESKHDDSGGAALPASTTPAPADGPWRLTLSEFLWWCRTGGFDVTSFLRRFNPIPRASEESATVARVLTGARLVPGDTWCLVSYRWWQAWCDYTGFSDDTGIVMHARKGSSAADSRRGSSRVAALASSFSGVLVELGRASTAAAGGASLPLSTPALATANSVFAGCEAHAGKGRSASRSSVPFVSLSQSPLLVVATPPPSTSVPVSGASTVTVAAPAVFDFSLGSSSGAGSVASTSAGTSSTVSGAASTCASRASTTDPSTAYPGGTAGAAGAAAAAAAVPCPSPVAYPSQPSSPSPAPAATVAAALRASQASPQSPAPGTPSSSSVIKPIAHRAHGRAQGGIGPSGRSSPLTLTPDRDRDRDTSGFTPSEPGFSTPSRTSVGGGGGSGPRSGGRQSSFVRPCGRPGAIDNSELVGDCDDVVRPDATEHYHYVLVPEEAWVALACWYSGGPSLPRVVVRRPWAGVGAAGACPWSPTAGPSRALHTVPSLPSTSAMGAGNEVELWPLPLTLQLTPEATAARVDVRVGAQQSWRQVLAAVVTIRDALTTVVTAAAAATTAGGAVTSGAAAVAPASAVTAAALAALPQGALQALAEHPSLGSAAVAKQMAVVSNVVNPAEFRLHVQVRGRVVTATSFPPCRFPPPFLRFVAWIRFSPAAAALLFAVVDCSCCCSHLHSY